MEPNSISLQKWFTFQSLVFWNVPEVWLKGFLARCKKAKLLLFKTKKKTIQKTQMDFF